mmetsp:Transcript_3195/g.9045  ORF Transcript_3195/g.9045 Transcript_3195/m.9045 type:complete len:264 (+) Transcript_3195:75-866(+)
MIRLILAFSSVALVMSHGWIREPLTRLEAARAHWVPGMPDGMLRWSPQSSAGPNSCGAWGTDYTESRDGWRHFYNLAGLDVPVWAPGAEIDLKFQIMGVVINGSEPFPRVSADHGGQAWVMVSCAENITEDGPWTFLERALGDRGHHFLPSSPNIFAWPKGEIVEEHSSVMTSKWKVPADLRCPGGRGVGRWLWKTGSMCNDDMDRNTKKTTPFALSEFQALNDAFSTPTMPSCSSPEAKYSEAEYFITCFDFSAGPTTETLV